MYLYAPFGHSTQNIIDEQFLLKRMADVSINLFAMTSVLSRATRSLQRSQPSGQHEVKTIQAAHLNPGIIMTTMVVMMMTMVMTMVMVMMTMTMMMTTMMMMMMMTTTTRMMMMIVAGDDHAVGGSADKDGALIRIISGATR